MGNNGIEPSAEPPCIINRRRFYRPVHGTSPVRRWIGSPLPTGRAPALLYVYTRGGIRTYKNGDLNSARMPFRHKGSFRLRASQMAVMLVRPRKDVAQRERPYHTVRQVNTKRLTFLIEQLHIYFERYVARHKNDFEFHSNLLTSMPQLCCKPDALAGLSYSGNVLIRKTKLAIHDYVRYAFDPLEVFPFELEHIE